MHMDINWLLCIVTLNSLYSNTQTACTWPSDFVSSTWIDSVKGDMLFDTTTMIGWSFTVSVQSGATTQTLNQWECLLYDEANSYLLMKTSETFEQFTFSLFTAYRCLKLTKLTDYSYRYYQHEPIQSQVSSERLKIVTDGTLSTTAEVCDENNGASGSEFQVMIKSGFEASAKVTCPYYFLSEYSYTYTDTSSLTSCNQATDIGAMDACTNTDQLTFSYPGCSSTLVYSSSPTVWCVDVVPVGTDTYVSLYNGVQDVGTIDDSTTFMFSCMGVNSDNTAASVTSQNCKKDQSPSIVPQNNAGADVGVTVALTATTAPCPPCPVLSAPTKGNVAITTISATITATYVCESTYTLYGNDTRICRSDGTWSDTEPSCTCETPSPPTNGNFTTSTDGLTLTYTCTIGYVLVGDVTRTCQTSSNLWTGSDSTCDACASLTAPTDGSFSVASTGVTTLVIYTCNAGTSLNGVAEATCQTDSSWSLSPPTCTTCAARSDPASGTVTITTDGTTSTAMYSCTTGYAIVGTDTATCDIDGIWDNTAPTCVCSAPITPVNGSVSVSVDSTTASYTCDLWTTLNGISTRTCGNDGTGWSSTDPTCVECPVITTPINGTMTVASSGTTTTLSFTCDVGFTMNGQSSSTCNTDSTWTSNGPTCSTCDALSTVSSGSFSLTSDGTTTSVSYTCDVGTTISGETTISCASDGTWTTSSTDTSCVTCASLATVTSGSYQLNSNGTATTAEFQCTNEYTLVGETTSTCQSDGTWSVAQPQCVAPATTTTVANDASTDNSGGSNSLLPVVIALAILAVIFAVAFGIALWYIIRKRKNNGYASDKTDDNEKRSNDKEEDKYNNKEDEYKTYAANSFISNKAPMDHQRHMLDSRNLASSLAPMSSFTNYSPRTESVSPRSLQTPLSAGKLRLDLIRDTTSSSIMMNQPAPWSVKKTSGLTNKSETVNDNGEINKPMKTASGKSVGNGNAIIGDTTTFTNHSVRPRTENRNPLNLEPSIDGNVKAKFPNLPGQVPKVTDKSVGNGLQINPLLAAPDSKLRKPERNSPMSSSPREKTNANGFPGNNSLRKKKKSSLRKLNDRSSTPVKHQLEVIDPDECRTPRSNVISTVQ